MGSSRIAVLQGSVSPQGEVGRQRMDRCVWPGEGSRLEMSLESSLEGRGKARRGQVGHSQPHADDGGPAGSNSEPEGLALRSRASFSRSFVKHGVRV